MISNKSDSNTEPLDLSLFKHRLEKAVKRADITPVSVGLLSIHLDQFTSIIDRFGHHIAEPLLQNAIKLLNQNTRGSDMVSHVSDDKLMVIVENISKASHVSIMAEKIIRAFSRTMDINGHTIKMTASVGIAIYPECKKGLYGLIRSADWAMKRARDAGGNQYKFYSDNLSQEAIWKYRLESDLLRALELRQFELHYQPLFDLHEQKIVALEALLRWNHPDYGFLYPAAFIDELETSDMIIDVGEWVMDEACNQLKLLQTEYDSLVMDINISARQLKDPFLIKRFDSILYKHGISANHIELEITERQFVDKNDITSEFNIQTLTDMGINLALDDFGTGYSSEAYFQHFPENTIHTLKIDRSDIKGMMKDEIIAERVKDYIEFSHNKNIRVIAEGVEETAQLYYLEVLGVDLIQGNLLSKPLNASEIEEGLRRNTFLLESSKPLQELALFSH